MGRAAEIVREARRKSGLTQAALARLAGVTQSVISDYENGRREPSYRAVDRLVSAAGYTIELSPLSRVKQPMLAHVLSRAGELHRALDPLGARRIRVFGSVARGGESEASDVDLVVDLPAEAGMFTLLRMRHEAESVLGCPVDLVPADGLKPEVAEAVKNEAVTV